MFLGALTNGHANARANVYTWADVGRARAQALQRDVAATPTPLYNLTTSAVPLLSYIGIYRYPVILYTANLCITNSPIPIAL